MFSPDGTRIVATNNTTIVRPWDTVPYEQRYRQKLAYEKAKPKAARVLDIVTATAPQRDGAPDLRAVAESIRTDSAIDESVRHVAINLLMRRANLIRSKAMDVIDDVKTHVVFSADIRDAVQADTSLDARVLAAAINMARLIEDTPSDLFSRARRIVDDDDRSPADYEQARRAAATAFQSDPAVWLYAGSLAKAWSRLHQPGKAVDVWREHLDALRAATPTNKWKLANALNEYGKVLLNNDQAADAEPVLRECLSIREKALEVDDWRLAEARSNLGESLVKQSKFTEAETFLVELANAALDNNTSSEDDTTKAIQRVVDLYEAWRAAEPDKGYDAKAAQWRSKLPAPQPAEKE